MAGTEKQGQPSEWLDENRKHVRWPAARTALLSWGDREYLVKTRDLSLGGAGLRSEADCPPLRTNAHLAVVFESGVREFPADLVYVEPLPAGCRLGLRWGKMEGQQMAFLSEHYASPTGSWGNVP